MEFLLVVYILINGVWVPGEEVQGWGAMTYASEARCLESKARAEEIQADLKLKNPRAYDKRFACEAKPKTGK